MRKQKRGRYSRKIQALPRKKFLAVLAGIFVLIFLPAISRAPEDTSRQLQSLDPVTILFVGDIMLSRQVGSIIEREGSDYPFALISDFIRSVDLTFGNLENPVSDRGQDHGSIYSFRADPDVLSGLWRSGFDVVSLANNHMFDWGEEAFVDTFAHLDSMGILFAGAGTDYEAAHEAAVIQIKNQKIAFLAYSEFAFLRDLKSPQMARLSLSEIKKDIEQAKSEGASAIVISIHWGEEYETEHSLEQQYLAHAVIDAGATLVIGHHPHVVQEVEEYHGGLIAYSLGNFVFDQNFSQDTRNGLMLSVVIDDGKVASFREIPISFTPSYQPFAL